MADKTTQKEYLQDLILEVMQTNETSARIEQSSLQMNSYLNDINANAFSSFEILNDIASIMTGNNLAALEKAREDGKLQQRMIDAMEDVRDNTKKEKKNKDLNLGMGGIFGILAGLTAFLGGFIKGYIVQFKTVAVGFFKLFTGVLKMFGTWFSESALGKKIAAVWASVMKSVDNVVDTVKAFFKSSGDGGILSKIKSMWTSVKKFFMIPVDNVRAEFKLFKDAFGPTIGKIKALITPILDLGARMDDVKGFFTVIKDTVTGWVKNVFDKVKNVLGILGGGDSALAKIGKFFGKFLAPVTFLFTLWDTVKGAMAGYEEGGIFGAIKGALEGFLGSLVGEPLNMLKSAVSWLAEKLGFEAVSEALDSFDFMAFIKNSISGIWDWVKLIFTDPGAALTALWNNLVGEGGLMDMLFKPIDMLIDWITKKLGWRDENAPEFSMGNMIRGVWNTIVDWVASLVEAIPIVGGRGAKAIRSMKAETAGFNIAEAGAKKLESLPSDTDAAKVEKSSDTSASGDTLNKATAAKRNTETAAQMVQDTAMMSAGEAGAASNGGGSRSAGPTNNTVMNISNGKLPDRTDWTVGGGWGVAP